MNIYLGILVDLGFDDVDMEVVVDVEIVFFEGYLFDKDKGKEVFIIMVCVCCVVGGKVGIVIFDLFCVECYCDDFFSLIENELDYVIGNSDELKLLF